jgi:thymidine phosphorylase
MSGIAKIGERVERRQPLAVLHANDRGRIEQALGPAAAAFEVTAEPPPAPRLILDCLAPDNPREDE